MNDTSSLDIPPESVALKQAYRQSGLTVADLAVATGLSTGTIHIAMSGVRYRKGVGKVTTPPDATVVKLATVLRIHPNALRALGRDRAADLLAEAIDEPETVSFTRDREAQALAAGRAALVRQLVALLSTEELRAEVERRDHVEHDRLDREAEAEIAEDLRIDQSVF